MLMLAFIDSYFLSRNIFLPKTFSFRVCLKKHFFFIFLDIKHYSVDDPNFQCAVFVSLHIAKYQTIGTNLMKFGMHAYS